MRGDKNPQVYLAPITPRMEMRDIEERFARFGPIRDIQIKRGFGFIVRRGEAHTH